MMQWIKWPFRVISRGTFFILITVFGWYFIIEKIREDLTVSFSYVQLLFAVQNTVFCFPFENLETRGLVKKLGAFCGYVCTVIICYALCSLFNFSPDQKKLVLSSLSHAKQSASRVSLCRANSYKLRYDVIEESPKLLFLQIRNLFRESI